jgi:hypothetical protein
LCLVVVDSAVREGASGDILRALEESGCLASSILLAGSGQSIAGSIPGLKHPSLSLRKPFGAQAFRDAVQSRIEPPAA